MSFAPALLVTLDLDDAATEYFEERRRRFFPAGRNRVPAHVMLFHRLPLKRRAAIEYELGSVTASGTRFDVTVGEPRSIGTGVAYDIRAEELSRLQTSLAARWSGELNAQDREPYRPHVVVQNKVSPQTARETLAILSDEFTSQTACATGLTLWLYRNGSWEEPKRFALKAKLS